MVDVRKLAKGVVAQLTVKANEKNINKSIDPGSAACSDCSHFGGNRIKKCQ